MVHEPAPVRWTVVPKTVQLPAAAKLTTNPDDAVALTVKSASPNVLPPGAANVIVWLPLVTVKVLVFCGAAFQLRSAAWSVVTVQVPAVSRVITPPGLVMVQTAGVVEP